MRRRHQRGLTIVETLVGLAIGLVVTAAAAALVLAQLREIRALWIQSRLMHDLRIAAEVVARDLRRAGHWRDATAPAWTPAGARAATANPHAALAPAVASDAARFSYSHDADADAVEPVAVRLRGGAIEMQLGDGPWQALTDTGSVVVTDFTITPTVEDISLQGSCARGCTAATPCPPTQSVRSVSVAIRGHAAADARIVRSVQSLVRLRNDVVSGACPS